ncbi:AraC family transcriptional regulator [Pelomonas sp. P7]|uniref:AraC family transcriptional regulator n=1 Tax=Pelomonas caseinilytica TaxID=2906763 RepID=A0ABS8XCU0_9BURK|nr:AraC family transcriptional regulator [Pelomonas sp. P7]MCE4536271.1 AraC family transcriptional regulator [Pelomonas sp. P7]
MRLLHAQFYGSFEARSDVAGFSLARLNARAADHDVEPHEHPDGHFIVVLAGRYRSSARGAERLLGPGDVLWNPPGTRHRDSFVEPGGRFAALSLGASQAAGLGLLDGGARRLRDAAQRFAQALAGKAGALDLGGLLQVEAGCHELCALSATVPRADAAAIGDRREPAWLRRCMEQLVDDCERPLRLADLAASAGVHPVSLSRAFRRRYGLSPGQLQRRALLNRAACRLREGQPIADVAAQLGFADQSHFTRLFRAEYRCTPAAWLGGFKTF